MPTTVTKTIGSSSRQYATVQLWEDALPANLVSGDTVQIGECYNDSEFTTSGPILQISGETTDATHTITLTCAAGQSFRDHASVQTNALRYNASNGVGLRKTSGYLEGIIVSVANVIFDGLQIREDTGRTVLTYLSGGAFVCNNCIVEGTFTVMVGEGLTAHNSVFIMNSTYAGFAMNFGYTNFVSDLSGCTIVRPSNHTPPTGACFHAGSGSAAQVIKNCAIFGFTPITDNNSKFSGTNNASDVASLGFGSSHQTSLTFTSQFENSSAGSSVHDFRAKAGGALIDNGVTDTNITPDIARTARPQGSAYDIGAWELSAGATPIQYNQSILRTTTPAPTLSRQSGKPVLRSTSPISSITRQIARSLVRTTTPVPSLSRAMGRSLFAATTPAPSISKQKARALRWTTSPAPSLSRQTSKALRAATTPPPTVTKASARSLLRTTTPVPAVAKGMARSVQASTSPVASALAQKAFLRALQATTAPIASLAHVAAKMLLSATTPVPSVGKASSRSIRATTTPTPTLIPSRSAILLTLQALGLATASLSRRTAKGLAASTTPAPSVTKATGRQLLASTTPASSLSRGFAKLLRASALMIADLATIYYPGGIAPPLDPIALFVRRVRGLFIALFHGNHMPAVRDLPRIAAIIQKATIGLDFGPMLPPDVVLSGTPTVTISVHCGTDASPQTRLTQAAIVGSIPISHGGTGEANTAVLFQMGNTLPDVVYRIVCSCPMTNGDVAVGWTHVPSVTPS